MEKILTDFDIQPVYLAAQAVNFIIVLLVLNKFLYKPLIKILQERKETITTSLLNAENIEHRLHETEQQSEKKLNEASSHAHMIIKNASNTADQIITEAHDKAKADIEIMMEKGKQSISMEREVMKNELRQELAELIVIGIEKVAGKVLDESDQKNILAKTIQGLEGNTTSGDA